MQSRPFESLAGLTSHLEKITRLRQSNQYLPFESSELDGSIPERFARIVDCFPDQVAIRQDGRQVTYSQLDRGSNRIANALHSIAGADKEPVLLLLDHGINQIEAILGIAKSGNFYTTLNPDDPLKRQKLIREELQSRLIITNSDHLLRAKSIASAGDLVFDSADAALHSTDEPIKMPIHPSDLMGVFYTSGTTGEPKGVPVNHRNALHRIWVHANLFYPCVDDRYSHLTSTSFTASISDLFTALLNGAVVCPRLITKNQGETLKTWINNEQITILRMIAPLLRAFIDSLDSDDLLPSVRLVIAGGDLFYSREARTLFDHLPESALLMNRLSAGEVGTVACMLFDRSVTLDQDILPVGYPVPGKEILIVDEKLQQVKSGEVGEIVIRSDFIFPGYWKRPDLTNKKLITDPLTGRKIVLSGDFGRFDLHGILEMLGRKDFMVKIRGYRVELQAVEHALASIDLVKEAAVIASDENEFEKRLIAYVVINQVQPQSVQLLRRALELKLPEYMIPSVFVFLDELPHTPNGKIDRKALPLPEGQRPYHIAEFIPPRTPVEQSLVDIWGEVLGLVEVGVVDPFLLLGGDSLKAVQILGRILNRFQVEISASDFFQEPTVGHLAELVEMKAGSISRPTSAAQNEDMQALPILRRSSSGLYPLSYSQLRMWFAYKLDPAGITYNEPKVHKIIGPLNPDNLERSLQIIIQRHEILRTRYGDHLGEPVQIISGQVDFKLPFLDLQSSSDPQAAFWLLCRQEIRKPFDLRHDLMIRAILYQIAHQEYMLLLMTHHIASDQTSSAQLFDELSLAYLNVSEGKPFGLPKLNFQYVDFAMWQRKKISERRLEEQFIFWRNKLSNIPELNLPFTKARSAKLSVHGSRNTFSLSLGLSKEIRDFSRQEAKTLFTTLFAAFSLLIYRYTSMPEFCLGTVVANRNRPELEKMLGFLVNTLAIRLEFSGDLTFRKHLDHIQQIIFVALDNQEYPFEKLVERLNPPRSANRHPFFQIIFSMDERKGGHLQLLGCQVERLDFHTGTSKFDLSLTVINRSETLSLRFEYNTQLFESQTIDRIAGDYQALLEEILADPDMPLNSKV
jgi:amino acid adenylation domain-containing protein